MITGKETTTKSSTNVSESKPSPADNMYCLVFWPDEDASTIVHSKSVLDMPVPGMPEGQVFVKIGPQYVPGIVKARGTIEEMCALERNYSLQDKPEQLLSHETVIAETQIKTSASVDSQKPFELLSSNSSLIECEPERNSSLHDNLKPERLQSHETVITETHVKTSTSVDLQEPFEFASSNSFSESAKHKLEINSSLHNKPEQLQSHETVLLETQIKAATSVDSQKPFDLANSTSFSVERELERSSSLHDKPNQLQSHETVITDTQMETATTFDSQKPLANSNSFTVVSVDFSPDHKIGYHEENSSFPSGPVASTSLSQLRAPPVLHLTPTQPQSSASQLGNHIPIMSASNHQGPFPGAMLKGSNKRKRSKGLASHRVADVFSKALPTLNEERLYGLSCSYPQSSSYSQTAEARGYNEALVSVGDVILPIVSSEVAPNPVSDAPNETKSASIATQSESVSMNSEGGKLQYLQGQIDCLMGRQMRLLQVNSDLELRVLKLESLLSIATSPSRSSSSNSQPSISKVCKRPAPITSQPPSHVVIVGSSSNPTSVPILTPTLAPYVTDQLVSPQVSFSARPQDIAARAAPRRLNAPSKGVLQSPVQQASNLARIQQVMGASEMREALQTRPRPQFQLSTVSSTGLQHTTYTGESGGVIPALTSTFPLMTQPQELLSVNEVLTKYRDLQRPENVTRLAVKLARESVFGHDLLTQSTPFGHTHFDALPAEGMLSIKEAIRPFCAYETPTEFELIWKSCVQSIGQACKHSRRPPKPPGTAVFGDDY